MRKKCNREAKSLQFIKSLKPEGLAQLREMGQRISMSKDPVVIERKMLEIVKKLIIND